MPTTFDDRLHAATRAGWRTLFVGVGVVALQLIIYLVMVETRPSWFLAIWGRDVTWSQVESIWLIAMVAMKVGLFSLALVLLWATWWRSALTRGSRDVAQVEPSLPVDPSARSSLRTS